LRAQRGSKGRQQERQNGDDKETESFQGNGTSG
jgi:hypothetical protein